MTEILKLNNVTAGYKSKIVLHKINFSIKRAEFVSLLGPNASGKTTLFRVITGMLKPYQGKVIFAGKEILRISCLERASKIAVLPQFYNPPGYLEVEEFIRLGRFPRWQFSPDKDCREKIKEVMNYLNLISIKSKKLAELSGGQLQRVFIAQALVQEPDLLLLDEPTLHLDISHQYGLMDVLKKLNEERKITIIAVLHDLNLASEFSQRLLLLNKGRLVGDGDPWQVLDYRLIEVVYETNVVVKKNPYSGKPFIIPYNPS